MKFKCLLLWFGITLACSAQVYADSTAQGAPQEQSGGCTAAEHMCGATYFTHPLTNQLWRKLGPATTPTNWTGPENVSDGHVPAIYQVTWRLGVSDSAPKGFQIVHTLGGTFYYREDKPLPADPSTFGYTQQDFVTGDALPTAFPDIAGLFPDGAAVKACSHEGYSYYLVTGRKSSVAYLLIAPATMAHIMRIPEANANVAMLPVSALGSDLYAIMGSLNYYFLGGDYEVAEFSAAYYYLSRSSADAEIHEIKSMSSAAPAIICPEFPKFTANGIEYPDSWKKAVKAFKD